jgi:hypothetical protein
MELYRDSQKLKVKCECIADFPGDENETSELVCMDWNYLAREWTSYFSTNHDLRKSIGVDGVAATPGAYERVGVLRAPWFYNY